MMGRDDNRDTSSSNFSKQSALQIKCPEESFLLNIINESSKILKENYNYSYEEIYELFIKGKKDALLVPVSIFSINLAPAEALIKYLKEKYDMNYHEMSVLINRNERSVWANYQRAIKKRPSKFKIDDTLFVPVSIFKDNRFSILECLISYLKDVKQMKNSKIAAQLKKHPNNIWTIYNRKKSKEKKQQDD